MPAYTPLSCMTTSCVSSDRAVPSWWNRTSFCAAAVSQNDSPAWLKPQPSSPLHQLRHSSTAEGAVSAPLARNAHPAKEGKGFLPGLAKLTVIQGSVRGGGKEGTGPILSTAEPRYPAYPDPKDMPSSCPSTPEGVAHIGKEEKVSTSLRPAAKTLFAELCHQTDYYYLSLGNRSFQLGNSSGATGLKAVSHVLYNVITCTSSRINTIPQIRF